MRAAALIGDLADWSATQVSSVREVFEIVHGWALRQQLANSLGKLGVAGARAILTSINEAAYAAALGLDTAGKAALPIILEYLADNDPYTATWVHGLLWQVLNRHTVSAVPQCVTYEAQRWLSASNFNARMSIACILARAWREHPAIFAQAMRNASGAAPHTLVEAMRLIDGGLSAGSAGVLVDMIRNT